MKRMIAVLLAVMLLVAAVPAVSMAENIVSNGDTRVYHVQTNGGTLYLRYKAGLNADIVDSLANGTALKKVSSKTVRKNGYKWINVKTMHNTKGWVASKYVRDYARADVVTSKSGLNVRSSRSARSDKNILYSIPHGTRGITVYKVNGNWAQVSWRGRKKGWASLNYLRWARW